MSAAILLLASGAAIGWVGLRPRGSEGPLAVVFPPWWSGAEALRAVSAADVAVVRSGAWPALLVVRAGPGALARLRASGAWAVWDGRAFGGCVPRV